MWIVRIGKRLIALAAVVGLVRVVGCAERLFYHPDKSATPPPRNAERVYFASADGTRLCGWWIPARRAPDHPNSGAVLPTVIHVHGNAGTMADHVWFTNYLPSHGYNLFIFDYRGYGESEGSAWRRRDLIADTQAAINYVLSRPDVNQDRVGLYGQSLGGAIALNAMRARTEIRSAVLESSFTSWRDAAASVLGGGSPGAMARFIATILIDDSQRPLDAIASIDRPILIVHGTADRIVPVEHGQRLASAAANSVETLFLEGGEHNSLLETHPELRHAVLRFFRRTLPVDE